jgi:hypothetical protein
VSGSRPVESNLEFAREERTAVLLHEGRLLRSLADGLRSSQSFQRLLKPNRGSRPSDALAWWKRNGGLPPALSVVKREISSGGQPVFCNISLCLPSSRTLSTVRASRGAASFGCYHRDPNWSLESFRTL